MMFSPLPISDLGEDVIHSILVTASMVVLAISISAYARKRSPRYVYLMLAFLFLSLSQVDSFYETFFLSDKLIVVPSLGLHVVHLLNLLMIISFGAAVLPGQTRGDEKSELRTH